MRENNPRLTTEVIARQFDGFQTFGERDLISAKRQAIQFCVDMASGDRPARWLSFLGTSGGGKSMLTKIINRIFGYLGHLPDEMLCRQGDRVLRKGGMKSWSCAVADMRQGDFTGVHQLKHDWFVCLDDIGAEHQTAMILGKLYEVLTAREGRFTVINANLTLEGLAALDVRIASRLKRDGSVLCEIETTDFNLR